MSLTRLLEMITASLPSASRTLAIAWRMSLPVNFSTRTLSLSFRRNLCGTQCYFFASYFFATCFSLLVFSNLWNPAYRCRHLDLLVRRDLAVGKHFQAGTCAAREPEHPQPHLVAGQ